jgi:hypothetical protein
MLRQALPLLNPRGNISTCRYYYFNTVRVCNLAREQMRGRPDIGIVAGTQSIKSMYYIYDVKLVSSMGSIRSCRRNTLCSK